MPNRREFLAGSAALAATSQLEAAPAKPAHQRALMKVGTQQAPTTRMMLQYFKRHAVDHICGYPIAEGSKTKVSMDDLKRLKEDCEKEGVALDMIPLPMASSYITKSESPNIMMGKSPERDREIDRVCEVLRECSQVGIPAVKYNLTVLGVLRTGTTPGRGGTKLSTWNLSEAKQDPPLTEAGPSPAPVMWERITYFLNRVVPVANEYKIRLACHPHDPGVPPTGFRGVDRVLGTVDGLKKFIAIQESPYHGLNFCQGTVSEMLSDPANQLADVIRYFGERKKIFNVHFRNIRGHRDQFIEVFPDEGDVNFWKIIQVYKEVGYDGMLMPDHMPRHDDDPQQLQAFAYSFGYIKALIQAVDQV